MRHGETIDVSSTAEFWSLYVISVPNNFSSFDMVTTSRSFGILAMVDLPTVKRVEARTGKAAFFDPLIMTSP